MSDIHMNLLIYLTKKNIFDAILEPLKMILRIPSNCQMMMKNAKIFFQSLM